MPEHPVIRTHPDTLKKVIYVNAAFTQYIKDWDPEESKQMLNYLYSKPLYLNINVDLPAR